MPELVDKWDKKQIGRQASFFQSSKWAEFQESVGNKPFFLEGNGWTCLILKKKNEVGSYLFAPYGPVLDKPEVLADCISELASLARTIGANWIKIEPIILEGAIDDLHKSLKAAGAIKASRDLEPALTRIIDVTPAADELLAKVSQSTRSMIRKNQRENFLSFKTSTDPKDMPKFISMLETVADRRGIGFFPPAYFLNQAKLLMPAGMMYLELAYDGQKPVGSAIMHDYGSISCYTFAAALPEAQKKSVAALLLWQAMINAKARGIKTIDLYGTAPDDAPPSHPWYGLSANKRKFGGQIVAHAGTWDIPLNRKYKLYRLAQKVQRLKRQLSRR